MTVQIARRHFTVSEYYRMAEAGIISEDDRVELIEGEVITMSPTGSLHSACVKRLNKLLNKIIDPTVLVGVQDPIRLDKTSGKPAAAASFTTIPQTSSLEKRVNTSAMP